MDKEDEIKAMELFIEHRRKLAEFIIHLDEAVKGLGKNNTALAEAYRKALSDKPT